MTAATAAVNVPVAAPAAMVTDAGIVILALSLLSTTAVDCAATALAVTVQAAVPAAAKVAGEHEAELTVSGAAVGTTVSTVEELPAPAALAVTVAAVD